MSKNLILLIKVGYVAVILTFLLFLGSVFNKPKQIAEPEAEVFVSATDEVEKQTSNYSEYIPVYNNGVEYNLYDMMSSQQIIYFKRDDCEDCKKYHSMIIQRLTDLDYPYLTIETSKDAAEYPGLAISSSIVKSIGISQVPTLAFIRDKEWVTKIENDFTMAGTEIALTCQQVYH